MDISRQARGPLADKEKRVDLALAVDGSTLIIYVKTIRSPYQFMCLQELKKLGRVVDQMAGEGLASL